MEEELGFVLVEGTSTYLIIARYSFGNIQTKSLMLKVSGVLQNIKNRCQEKTFIKGIRTCIKEGNKWASNAINLFHYIIRKIFIEHDKKKLSYLITFCSLIFFFKKIYTRMGW